MASNLRVDQIISSTTGSVSIGTATFTGGLSGDITGLNVTGVITATTLNQNVSGILTAQNGIHVTGGSVGIGTDNPFGTLQVRSGTNANFSFSTGGGEASLELINDAGSTNVPVNVRASEYKIKIQGTEKLRITSDGNVGIGTDNPKAQTWRNGTALDVYGGAGNVVGNLHIGANRGDGVQTVGSIVFYDNTQDTNHKVISIIESDKTGSTTNQRGGTVSVYVKEDATVSNSAVESATFTKDGISFPSGNGIDFSATADGSGASNVSELLDDYEEGTFTLTCTASGGTTITSYGASGRYTKIGRMVHVHIIITISDQGTANGQYLNFIGLPFTSANTFNQVGVAREQSINGYLSTAQVTGNATSGALFRWDNSGVIVNGGNWQMSIVYEAQ